MYEGENDPYIDESTGILKNLLRIKNAQNLESAEYNIAYARSMESMSRSSNSRADSITRFRSTTNCRAIRFLTRSVIPSLCGMSLR